MRTSLLALIVAAVVGQTGTQPYVGTWTAAVAGNTFIRVELTAANGALVGRIGIGNFVVDANGDLKSASPITRMRPLADLVVRGSTLSFASKDGDDTDQFEMEVLSDQSARLKMILTDADIREAATVGVPPPNPIALTKLPQ